MGDADVGEASSTNGRISQRNRSFTLWGVALLVIIAGFADLVRGGTTVAPILLVIGYCVLVPIAILK